MKVDKEGLSILWQMGVVIVVCAVVFYSTDLLILKILVTTLACVVFILEIIVALILFVSVIKKQG